MVALRVFGGACVLSVGRFAILGGWDDNGVSTRSCEALTLDGNGERWELLPPMHTARVGFACAAIGGCVFVAGGADSITAEVYEEALGRWRRLPCSLPRDNRLVLMGSALMYLSSVKGRTRINMEVEKLDNVEEETTRR